MILLQFVLPSNKPKPDLHNPQLFSPTSSIEMSQLRPTSIDARCGFNNIIDNKHLTNKSDFQVQFTKWNLNWTQQKKRFRLNWRPQIMKISFSSLATPNSGLRAAQSWLVLHLLARRFVCQQTNLFQLNAHRADADSTAQLRSQLLFLAETENWPKQLRANYSTGDKLFILTFAGSTTIESSQSDSRSDSSSLQIWASKRVARIARLTH